MIRDRGKMKWTAFMMPEHVSMIKRFAEDEQKQRKPELDEQELEEIGIIVMESLHYTLPIKITMWKNGCFYKHSGTVTKLDYLEKYIIFHTEEDKHRIMINEITKVARV